MTESTLLQRIPGRFIGSAAAALPLAATDTENFRMVIVDVPEVGKIELVYKRQISKIRRNVFYYWCIESAAYADEK